MCTYEGVLCSHKELRIYIICRKMDGTEDHVLREISQIQKDKYHPILSDGETRPNIS
jgi:hypothetical protein